MTKQPLLHGSRVFDRDGREGTIVGVTNFCGSSWYDVRFPSGVAVRYPKDLTTTRPRDDAAERERRMVADYVSHGLGEV